MKVVIACAGSKTEDAGALRTPDGNPIEFVARPSKVANRDKDIFYARPDDIAHDGVTWRDELLEYNASRQQTNPCGLVPAYKLYKPVVYRRLVDVFGIENVYILSAGWGLVKASFLLPKYDITFSSQADRCKRRGKRDGYDDLNDLEKHTDDDLLFFGGQGYLSLFYKLTDDYSGRRIVYFKSKKELKRAGFYFVPFDPVVKDRNWHYLCAERVAERFESAPRDFDPLSVTS